MPKGMASLETQLTFLEHWLQGEPEPSLIPGEIPDWGHKYIFSSLWYIISEFGFISNTVNKIFSFSSFLFHLIVDDLDKTWMTSTPSTSP